MGGWGSVVLTPTRAEILDEALDPRQAADTSKSAESGNYEAFIVIHRCQLQLMQPQILTYKHDRITITTSFHSNSQLLLPALQKNTPGHPPIFRRFFFVENLYSEGKQHHFLLKFGRNTPAW